MTAQEAIKELNYDETAYGGKCTKPVREVAIEALEKQIPKKPDLEADGYADGQLVYDTWICPCCGEYYEVDYDDYDYCPNCGQAIDWSEQNE
jgi:hypothetical protein